MRTFFLLHNLQIFHAKPTLFFFAFGFEAASVDSASFLSPPLPFFWRIDSLAFSCLRVSHLDHSLFRKGIDIPTWTSSAHVLLPFPCASLDGSPLIAGPSSSWIQSDLPFPHLPWLESSSYPPNQQLATITTCRYSIAKQNPPYHPQMSFPSSSPSA